VNKRILKETPVLSLMRHPTTAAIAKAIAIDNPRTLALAPELARAYAGQRQHPTTEGEARLRAATLALVRRLKSDGLTPERVVVAVKTAIMRYGNEHRPPSLVDEEGHSSTGVVYERLFQWILDAYFDATPRAAIVNATASADAQQIPSARYSAAVVGGPATNA
jgi:hypothetical protein